MGETPCRSCDPEKGKQPNGNCKIAPAGDGLPVQCVGEWTRDKHYYVSRYVDATRGEGQVHSTGRSRRGGVRGSVCGAWPGSGSGNG